MLNEWKESSSYMYTKWFADLGKQLEQYFETDIYNELEFDEFEYDSTLLNAIQTGFLYFHEKEFQYKVEIIIDNEKVEEDEIIDVEFRLQGFRISDGENIGTVQTDTVVKDINEDLLINLINQFKEEYELDINI